METAQTLHSTIWLDGYNYKIISTKLSSMLTVTNMATIWNCTILSAILEVLCSPYT